MHARKKKSAEYQIGREFLFLFFADNISNNFFKIIIDIGTLK